MIFPAFSVDWLWIYIQANQLKHFAMGYQAGVLLSTIFLSISWWTIRTVERLWLWLPCRNKIVGARDYADLPNQSFDDICISWQKGVRWMFNLPHRTPYIVWCEHTRDSWINRFKRFFDSLTSRNCNCSVFGFQCSFNNTPVGPNRIFITSRNSARMDENGSVNGVVVH